MKVFFYNDTYIKQLVAFLRKVWDKDMTESTLIERRKRDMSENPYAKAGDFPIAIAMLNDQIIGHHAGTPTEILINGKEVLSYWLSGLHVLPEGRRKGVAKALQNTTNQLPIATSFWVIEATLRVKKKLGWTVVGKIPEYIKILDAKILTDSINENKLPQLRYNMDKAVKFFFSNRKSICAVLFHWFIKTQNCIFSYFLSKRLIRNQIRVVKNFDARIDRLWNQNKNYLKNAQVRQFGYLNWKFKNEKGWIKIVVEKESNIFGYAILCLKKIQSVKHIKDFCVLSIIDIFWDFKQPEVLWDLFQYIENMGRQNNATVLICSINNKAARNILIRNGYFRIPGTVYFGFHITDHNLELSSKLDDWFITRGDADAAGSLGPE